MTLKRVQNIFIPKNMNCITTIMSLEDNQKIKMTTKQTEHSCKHANRLKPQFQPTKGATRSYKGIIMVFIEKLKRMKLLFELKVFSRNILRDLTYTKSALPRHFSKQFY